MISKKVLVKDCETNEEIVLIAWYDELKTEIVDGKETLVPKDILHVSHVTDLDDIQLSGYKFEHIKVLEE